METALILFLTTAGPAVAFVGFAVWRGDVLARGGRKNRTGQLEGKKIVSGAV